MGPQQWDRRQAGPEEALPIRNLRQESQCPLKAYPFTHAYMGNTQP